MKRREILWLLTGCMLLFTPIKAQAASLPDALAIGTINISEETPADEKSGEDKESDKSGSQEANDGDNDSISNNAAQNGGSDEASQDEKEDKTAASKSDDTSLQDILGGGSIGSGAIREGKECKLGLYQSGYCSRGQ